MVAIAYVVNTLIDLYIFVLIATIIASWLIAFGIVNPHNQVVGAVLRTCHALTEPVLRPIRNLLPSLGGIDISPIFVFIGLRALQVALNTYVFAPAVARGL